MSEREVLIHLNITVEADTDEAAVAAAEAYCYRHNIPVDDIAAVDPL